MHLSVPSIFSSNFNADADYVANKHLLESCLSFSQWANNHMQFPLFLVKCFQQTQKQNVLPGKYVCMHIHIC